MNKDELIGAVARGWCSKKNEHKIMDPDLVEAIVEEIGKLPQEPYLGCATTAELLDEVRCRIEIDGMLEYRTVDSEEHIREVGII